MSDPTLPRKRHDPAAGASYFDEWKKKFRTKGDLQRAIVFRLRSNEKELGLHEEPVPYLVSMLEVGEAEAMAMIDPARSGELLELRRGQLERAVRWIYGNTNEQEFQARRLIPQPQQRDAPEGQDESPDKNP